jgi:hypothetical protein
MLLRGLLLSLYKLNVEAMLKPDTRYLILDGVQLMKSFLLIRDLSSIRYLPHPCRCGSKDQFVSNDYA